MVAASKQQPVKASDDLSHELTAEEQRTVALFERCSGSVVHINTFVQQEFLVRSMRGLSVDLQEIPRGTGSGFIWDKEHIVTNYHVIKDADKAMVVMADHTSIEAVLVGAEPDCDLAVLKLKSGKKNMPLEPLERGRSHNLHVGQKVFAIGNPFGLDQTLTSGIVSGLGREMRGVSGRVIRNLVQTDAAINPGNSGGPLLDARGRLIGVNTMIASPSGAFAGVGFAIPVDTVLRVVQQIVEFGHTKRPYLGVFPLPESTTMKFSLHLKQRGAEALEGVVIMALEPGSPADKAGLRPTIQTNRGIVLGDELLKVQEQKVTSAEELLDAVEQHQIGEQVTVTFKRRQDGQTTVQKAKIQLGEKPSRQVQANENSMGSMGTVPVQGNGHQPRSRM